MCDHGDTVTLRVPIPGRLSYTGCFRWANKPIDRCLVPAVQALNFAGVFTANSCCGHGDGVASIALHDGGEISLLEVLVV